MEKFLLSSRCFLYIPLITIIFTLLDIKMSLNKRVFSCLLSEYHAHHPMSSRGR